MLRGRRISPLMSSGPDAGSSSGSLGDRDGITLTLARTLRRRYFKPVLFLILLSLALTYAFPHSPVADYISRSVPLVPRHSLVLDQRTGLAGEWELGESKHPIEVLMEMGKKKWERMLRRWVISASGLYISRWSEDI